MRCILWKKYTWIFPHMVLKINGGQMRISRISSESLCLRFKGEMLLNPAWEWSGSPKQYFHCLKWAGSSIQVQTIFFRFYKFCINQVAANKYSGAPSWITTAVSSKDFLNIQKSIYFQFHNLTTPQVPILNYCAPCKAFSKTLSSHKVHQYTTKLSRNITDVSVPHHSY